MKRIRMVVLGLALLAAGCADGGNWTRPDTAPEIAAKDFGACRTAAREATRRDDAIDADIMASRGADWQRAGILAEQRSSMADEKSKHGDAVVADCMSAKGYRQAK